MRTIIRLNSKHTVRGRAMESEACVTSLSRSDLNSAFCDTSQSDKCSADSLSFDSSGRDCTCASTTDVSTNNSNEHTGPELSQSQVTPSPTKQSNSIYLDNGTDHHHAKPLTPKLKKTRLTMVCVCFVCSKYIFEKENQAFFCTCATLFFEIQQKMEISTLTCRLKELGLKPWHHLEGPPWSLC